MAIVSIVSTEFHRDGVITNSTRPSRVLLNLSDLTAMKAFKNEVWWWVRTVRTMVRTVLHFGQNRIGETLR